MSFQFVRVCDILLYGLNDIFAYAEEQNKMAESIGELLNKVLEAAYTANDVSRNMENEIAYQRDITDKARTTLDSYQ